MNCSVLPCIEMGIDEEVHMLCSAWAIVLSRVKIACNVENGNVPYGSDGNTEQDGFRAWSMHRLERFGWHKGQRWIP